MGYHWEETPSQKPIDNIIWIHNVSEWEEKCNASSDACIIRRYKGDLEGWTEEDTCFIIWGYSFMGNYLSWHERKHCAGYNHYEP